MLFRSLIDVVIQARDAGLYSAITDCGVGGLSSAIGEMGEQTGARVVRANISPRIGHGVPPSPQASGIGSAAGVNCLPSK